MFYLIGYIVFFYLPITLLSYKLCSCIYKYFIISELNLLERYGENSWAVITGASSGQGRQFALDLAKRGFNIMMIGSIRTDNTCKEINSLYPTIKTKVLYKDFCRAFEDDFFHSIEEELHKISTDFAILINNVGHRVAWKPYHEMNSSYIRDIISVGTIVQSRLIHMSIPVFLHRKNIYNKKSCIISITAQCNHPNILLGLITPNEITVPYLSVYEGANVFGLYQMSSIYEEYKGDFDLLNITPGVVVTENTHCIKNVLFSIDSEKYVNNILKLVGNVQGTTCAYWGHELSTYLINLCPMLKRYITFDVGNKLATNFMNSIKNNEKYKLNN